MSLEANVVLEGQVVNGVVVLDEGARLPEGTRVQMRVVTPTAQDDEELDQLILPDPSLPPDHPLAPYNRETELAILRKSIEDAKAGRTRPFEEVMAEIAARHNLPPAQPE